MLDVMTFVYFVVGIAALVVGAEVLVRGAARIAARTGLSPVVVGLTVVAFGTSAPELAVSVGAAFRDEASLAIGNVVGSNIANILLVLGISAAVAGSLVVAQRIVRIDVPIMLGASVLLLIFGMDGSINRWEGLLFVVALVGYITWTVVSTQRSGEVDAELAELNEDLSDEVLQNTSVFVDVGFVIAGLVLLVGGSTALVASATAIAAALGVSELVIGLTVVSIGTSMPEIATSVVAAARGERDLAVGGAVGSNLFNILAVIGVTATVSPSSLSVPDVALELDFPIMIAVAFACLPIFANGFNLQRWEGFVFLGFYAAYLIWLVLAALDHDIKRNYGVAMLGFVLPLTIITMIVLGMRDRKRALAPVE